LPGDDALAPAWRSSPTHAGYDNTAIRQQAATPGSLADKKQILLSPDRRTGLCGTCCKYRLAGGVLWHGDPIFTSFTRFDPG